MADRYWIATAGTKYWDDDANWSSSSGGSGGASFPVAGDAVYFDAGSAVTCLLRDHEACAAISIANGGTLDIVTYNLVSSGAMTLTNSNSTIKIGTSSNTGLTTAGITWNTGTKRDWQTGSKINCSGNWLEPDESISTANHRGTVTLTGSGNINKPNGANYFYIFKQNSGITTTMTSNTFIGSILNEFTINGTLNVNGFICTLGTSSSATVTIGSGADISGSGTIITYFISSTTFTNNKSGAFSFSGTFILGAASTNNLIFPSWDLTSAIVIINGGLATGLTRLFTAGTLKCKSLTIQHNSNNAFVVNNSTNNPSFYISQSVTFTPGTGGLTYTKGTGTITLDGTSGTYSADFQGKVVEDIIVNCGTGVKQLVSNVTTDSLTINGGTFDLTTYACTSVGATVLSNSNSTIKIGTSAGTGLTTAGITWNTGTKRDWQTGSKINCSGNWIEPNENISNNNFRGTVVLTGSGNIAKPNSNNQFYSFTNNTGVTTTLTVNCYLIGITGSATINGTIAGAYTVYADGAITCGSAALLCAVSWYLSGASGTQNIDFNNKQFTALTVDTTGAVKNFTNGFTAATWVINDKAQFNDAKTYGVTDISGSGELESIDGDLVVIYYIGTDTFAGTLDNVVLIKDASTFSDNERGAGLSLGMSYGI